MQIYQKWLNLRGCFHFFPTFKQTHKITISQIFKVNFAQSFKDGTKMKTPSKIKLCSLLFTNIFNPTHGQSK